MLSLYVHIPFCARKCLYCSFAVAISAEKHAASYLDCLAIEADGFKGGALETIYIGGGTPSRLSAEQIGALMQIIKARFDCNRVVEVTMEANPEDIDEDRLSAMKEGGIERISLGVQTFHEGYLKYLGRNHDARAIIQAAEMIKRFNFKSVNMDLMFGFERQSLDESKKDLDGILELGPDHVSLYGLTIEPNSRFFAQGKVASNDQQAEMYAMIMGEMKGAQYHQYEISNFSRPGHESRHNRNYWLGKNYIGLGMGAHSHLDGKRWWNTPRLADYMARLVTGACAQEGSEQLSDQMRKKERFLFGLRMGEGVEMGSLGISLPELFDQTQLERLNAYIREGLLKQSGPRICATDKGRMVLDEISTQLI